MILAYRPITVWPDGWDKENPPDKGSPFSATFADTLEILDRELTMIDASSPTLQVDAPEARIRMDGQLHAQAQVDYPGVILSFATADFGTLTYACNRFSHGGYGHNRRPGWHENLRAIALGLEALRRVERYGIADRGQEYAGWAAIGSGIPMGPVAMTEEHAWTILIEGSGLNPTKRTRKAIPSMYRAAVRIHHPDNGGDPKTFDQITKAKEFLDANAPAG